MRIKEKVNAPKESSDVTTDEPKEKIHDKCQSVDRTEGEGEDELYDIPLIETQIHRWFYNEII